MLILFIAFLIAISVFPFTFMLAFATIPDSFIITTTQKNGISPISIWCGVIAGITTALLEFSIIFLFSHGRLL